MSPPPTDPKLQKSTAHGTSATDITDQDKSEAPEPMRAPSPTTSNGPGIFSSWSLPLRPNPATTSKPSVEQQRMPSPLSVGAGTYRPFSQPADRYPPSHASTATSTAQQRSTPTLVLRKRDISAVVGANDDNLPAPKRGGAPAGVHGESMKPKIEVVEAAKLHRMLMLAEELKGLMGRENFDGWLDLAGIPGECATGRTAGALLGCLCI